MFLLGKEGVLVADVEQWKDIDGYEGLYQISSYGRVKSFPRRATRGGIVKPSLSTSGYLCTHLSKNGKVRTHQVHRLVAKHFICNPDNLPEVNHIDENKTNNHVSNLEWCTRVQNVRHGTAIERMVKAHDYKKVAAKSAANHDYREVARKEAKPLLQFDKNGNLIKRWESLRAASRALGKSCGNISAACNGKQETSYGFVWRYEEDL